MHYVITGSLAARTWRNAVPWSQPIFFCRRQSGTRVPMMMWLLKPGRIYTWQSAQLAATCPSMQLSSNTVDRLLVETFFSGEKACVTIPCTS